MDNFGWDIESEADEDLDGDHEAGLVGLVVAALVRQIENDSNGPSDEYVQLPRCQHGGPAREHGVADLKASLELGRDYESSFDRDHEHQPIAPCREHVELVAWADDPTDAGFLGSVDLLVVGPGESVLTVRFFSQPPQVSQRSTRSRRPVAQEQAGDVDGSLVVQGWRDVAIDAEGDGDGRMARP